MVTQLENKNAFTQFISKGHTIVDFWAEWCGPCKMLAPIFEKVSKDLVGKVNFAKVDTESNEWAAEEFEITGIPCLIVFKEGKEVGRIIGLRDEAGLKREISKIVGS